MDNSQNVRFRIGYMDRPYGGVHQSSFSVRTLPPVVVDTVPEAGQTNVDPGLGEIRVKFSKRMKDQCWSWSQISDDTFPEVAGDVRFLSDQRTCIFPVKLEPRRTYALWLNAVESGHFKDTEGQSAVPYLLVFQTAKHNS